ncbi:MAG: hypothetical protein GW893_23710 [Armatimonadetes bacterium]|nr:hypothetical protein [Armatimonadota bacterium]
MIDITGRVFDMQRFSIKACLFMGHCFGESVILTHAALTPLIGNTGWGKMTTNAPFFYAPRTGATLGGGAFGRKMSSIPYQPFLRRSFSSAPISVTHAENSF